ncbi:MAG TPA: GAF domain-containing protein [Ramlibacter sp.]
MHDEVHSAASAPTLTGRQALLDAACERVGRMIEDGAPLRAILAHLATTSEALSGSTTVASILILDGEGLLRNGASPNLPADYLDKIDRLKPDPTVGTCAAAAATGEVVLTPSFYADQRWSELRQLPLALGFLGAWSMPIKSADGRVLGTFGTYFREHREPTVEEREAVAVLAGAAARAIEARSVATAD